MGNQNKTRTSILYILKILYTWCFTNETEHLKFQEKLSFTHSVLVNSGKLKQKIWDQDTIHFEVAICRVLHERCNNTDPFLEHLKFQERVTFTHAILVNSVKLKQKIWDDDTIHFEVTICRVLHERCNNTDPIVEQLRFQEKVTLGVGLIVENQNKKTKTKILNLLKMLYIYRVLHERSNITASFTDRLKFQEKVTFTHARQVNDGK